MLSTVISAVIGCSLAFWWIWLFQWPQWNKTGIWKLPFFLSLFKVNQIRSNWNTLILEYTMIKSKDGKGSIFQGVLKNKWKFFLPRMLLCCITLWKQGSLHCLPCQRSWNFISHCKAHFLIHLLCKGADIMNSMESHLFIAIKELCNKQVTYYSIVILVWQLNLKELKFSFSFCCNTNVLKRYICCLPP